MEVKDMQYEVLRISNHSLNLPHRSCLNIEKQILEAIKNLGCNLTLSADLKEIIVSIDGDNGDKCFEEVEIFNN